MAAAHERSGCALFLVLVVMQGLVGTGRAVELELFTRCRRGPVAGPGEAVTAQSEQDCVRQCALRPSCSGVDICPASGGGGDSDGGATTDPQLPTCTMHGQGFTTATCPSATVGASLLCYFAFKTVSSMAETTTELTTPPTTTTIALTTTTPTTTAPTTETPTTTPPTTETPTITAPTTETPTTTALTAENPTTTASTTETPTTIALTCENGAVWDGSQCACQPSFRGATCQHAVRDCFEIHENLGSSSSSSHDGVYDIQPVNSTSTSKVHCSFTSEGGATVVLRRTVDSSFGKTYSVIQAGFGNPANDLYQWFFFTGLDNLHRLTQQADYRLLIKHSYEDKSINNQVDGQIVYHEFKVDSEATKYRITYGSYDSGASTLDPVWTTPTPTWSPSPDGCNPYSTPCWYDQSDCRSYTVFWSIPFWWTVNGYESQPQHLVLFTEFLLTRTSSFHDNN